MSKFLDEVPGLMGVVVSTSDSVSLGQLWKSEEEGSATAATIFPFIVEQVSKMLLGGLRSLSAQYEDVTIVNLNVAPLVFTFVGAADLETDALTSKDLRDRLEQGFKPLIEACN
mmetsp:Transcript_5464/g.17523  ORF Transcript_5464/g.17523 Transcript_5464/m.17523 type:complete len:114 (-) Transcript_5464:60-401(-)